MPTIDPNQLTKGERHRLIIGSIVPRPIAWVTTISTEGVINLAPFSYFTGVCSTPACLAISIGARDPAKDTLANIKANGEAVVHLVPPDYLETANQSGAEYAPGVSEVEELKLPTVPSQRVAPPRLADAEIALECRLHTTLPVGSPASTLCVLEVLVAHINDESAQADGLPDPKKVRAVARLGETCYLRADQWNVVTLDKPQAPPGKGRYSAR